MPLNLEQYRTLKTLLLGLPGWNDEDQRRAFVREALYGHAILQRWSGQKDPDTAAGNLLDAADGDEALTEDGKTPLCALLSEIRSRGWAGGERAGFIARLERDLGCKGRKVEWERSPYPGLMAFDRADAPIFFGRAAETDDLLGRLCTEQGERFLLVTGASGSGKSSLVRAGVWAALAAGKMESLPGSERWLITAMFPSEQGGDPFEALTASLKQDTHGRFNLLRSGEEAAMIREGALQGRHAPFQDLLQRLQDSLQGGEWLLILDQMEELFTPACEALREPFLDLLLDASSRPGFRVIATVRSDFLHRCIDHSGLLAVQNNNGQYGVRAPGPRAMTSMITGPVEKLELTHPVELAPDLVTTLVDDAVSELGGLPLLAFALKDLYDQCRATGRMDLAAYHREAFGGLKGVIQRRADAALKRAGEAGRGALPRVFSRLLTVQADGTATRRREPLSTWANDPEALRLIEEFTRPNTRLLITGPDDNPTLEVAHEALLREWQTLTEWIEDRREALRLRDRIHEEVGIWVAEGRPAARLWPQELLAPNRELLLEADPLDALETNRDIADFLTPEPQRLLTELLCQRTDHPRREAIGTRLSEIGDPRPGTGVIDGVPDILWCAIPGGEVEIEDHGRFEVQPFHLAAYPVTCAQYRAFVEAEDGYHSDLWWEKLNKENNPGRQVPQYASYPANNVSWYDATAFCRWLSQRLGHEVRLPDEWEWQWAAQSAQAGFNYPWGEKWREGVANTSEAGIGRTTGAGMYPGGRSKEGIYALSGNVWEWCRNEYGDPRKGEVASEESRVLRGGSWLQDQGYARADYRLDDHPGYRYGFIGFRVLCASPIR